MDNSLYLNNPLIHKDRRLARSNSPWVRQFCVTDLKPLIICRGPIRKETIDVLDEMGIHNYGILLSEKDSITYTNAVAPELRKLTSPQRVHRVPDYSGASKEERQERINQIISIAKDNGYNSIFAGYGFMAEDEGMVESMEKAGLNFIGPCSKTVHDAGLKDEAKRTALNVGVSVTPGIDNVTALTLLKKHPTVNDLKKLVSSKKLSVAKGALDSESLSLEDKADVVLTASYDKGIDLFTVNDMAEVVIEQATAMYEQYPENRIRLKAISGGGGKGQRILAAPTSYEGSKPERLKKATEKAPGLVREILSEVKCNGVGDNKNVLIELNIETTRHQEIQVVGNGDWCITMGGRDCSLQMHEQKLLEVSVTREELITAIDTAKEAGKTAEIKTLKQDLITLDKMEEEAAVFGKAVGLDSVSTFECIVDGSSHFFMEMNTRIQVEHRVTELCYALQFTNPENPNDFFVVDSLVELMVLLARHGKSLPKPERIPRKNASVEARMNATNQALQPHAGGVIRFWSDPIEGEIRDDQGISMHNPDTGVFMKYHLAGAYDSNIALLLTTGNERLDSYQELAEVLRVTRLTGDNLCTNLDFHYGLVNWFIGQNVNARPTTRFIVPYLTAVGLLKEQANQIDLAFAYKQIRNSYLALNDDAKYQASMQEVIHMKSSLLERPVEQLIAQPHRLAGWLSLYKDSYQKVKGKLSWKENPIKLLANLYHFLNMDYRDDLPAAKMIWDHDNKLLSDALAFYAHIEKKLKTDDFLELTSLLSQDKAPKGISKANWQAVQASHLGYQAGMEVLLVLPYVAEKSNFYQLKVNADLSLNIPRRLTDEDLQDRMASVLVPPPVSKSDELVSPSGGMFYSREAPDMDTYVKAGSHFNAGDPLYIVEVMKMFNKVYAPFSGTIDKVLVELDGAIIKKGQPIFKVTPDKIVEEQDPAKIAAQKQKSTAHFFSQLAL